MFESEDFCLGHSLTTLNPPRQGCTPLWWKFFIIATYTNQIDIPNVYQTDRPLPSLLESQVLVIINMTTMVLDVGLHVMDKIVPKCPGKPGNRSPVVAFSSG